MYRFILVIQYLNKVNYFEFVPKLCDKKNIYTMKE